MAPEPINRSRMHALTRARMCTHCLASASFALALALLAAVIISSSRHSLCLPPTAKVYILAASMTKGRVTKRPAMVTSGGKARINETKDRQGYRVFRGSRYLGFFRSREQAELCAGEHDQGPAPGLAQAKLYRYVQAHKAKGKTVYYGVVRVPGTRKKNILQGVRPKRQQPTW